MKSFSLGAAIAIAGSVPVLAADWPQVMGPAGNGYTPEIINPAAVASPKILWRASTGLGGAPPVVADGKVFVLGGFEPGKEPAAASTPEKIHGHWDKPENSTPLDVWVTCLRAKDGTVVWRAKVTEGETFSRQAGIYASPLYDSGQVFVRTLRYVVALDAAKGAILWKLDLEASCSATTPYRDPLQTGQGGRGFMTGRGAPLMADRKLLVSYFEGAVGSFGGAEKHVDSSAACVALDPVTGKPLWTNKASKHTRNYDPEQSPSETGYDSWEPPLATSVIDGKPTVVMSTGHAVIGIDLASGKRLWVFNHAKELDSIRRFVNDADAATKPNPWSWWVGYGYVPPAVLVAGNIVVDRIFCGHGTFGTSLYAIEIKDGQPKLLWQTDELAARNAKYVLHDGKLYGLDLYSHLHTVDVKKGQISEWPRPRRPADMGQFQCRDVRTGKLLWSSDALYAGDKNAPKPEEFLCERHLHACPALNDTLRKTPQEGGYSYTGDPTFILAGDTLVFKSERQTLEGLFFAKLTGHGVEKLGGRPFRLGDYYLGEPVVAEGKCYIKLDNEKNGLEGSGNLICFAVGDM